MLLSASLLTASSVGRGVAPGVAEVPAFTQAIEAHQRRITEAILEHALKICSDKNVRG